jgi:hypothetical protein
MSKGARGGSFDGSLDRLGRDLRMPPLMVK